MIWTFLDEAIYVQGTSDKLISENPDEMKMKRKRTKRAEQISGIFNSGEDQAELISKVWESWRRLKLLQEGERNVWRHAGF